MSKVYLMMGLPGLGKSTYARDFIMNRNGSTIVVSSDDLRAALLNDIERQNENKLIFSLMRDITVNALLAGKDVIYDATNIKEDNRRKLIVDLKAHVDKLEAVGVYCVGTLLAAFNRNGGRDRQVPEFVIEKMCKNFEIPTARDNYLDRIEYFSIATNGPSSLGNLLDVINYEAFIRCMSDNIPSFESNLDLAQDCTYHSLSVSRHIYEAFKYAQGNMPIALAKHQNHILFALAFHDIGKSVCKEFRNGSKYAHFTGHEKVSAQIFMAEAQLHGCFWNGDSKIDIPFVGALIKEHGFPYFEKGIAEHEAALYRIEQLYGKEFRECLMFIRECDTAGK